MDNELDLNNSILAIITLKEKRESVGGGAPIFFVENKTELEETSTLLARLTLGMVHDLGNDVKIIIKH